MFIQNSCNTLLNTVFIRHAFGVLVNPLTVLIALFAMGVFWLHKHGDHVHVKRCFLIVLCTFLLLSTGWLPRFALSALQHQYPVVSTVDPKVHWIVVLGGGQLEKVDAPANHLLSKITIERLLEGVRLYRQLPGSKLILSGGGELPGKSEAARMGLLVSWFNIPAADVVLETSSGNTADEAVAIKAWVKEFPFYLVTSSLHLPRAMRLCQQQGLAPIAAPSDYPYAWEKGSKLDNFRPEPQNLLIAHVVWHEWIGRFAERLVGQL